MSTSTCSEVEQILDLFPKVKTTGQAYQDFETVDEATDFRDRMREVHGHLLVVSQSGRRVYLDPKEEVCDE